MTESDFKVGDKITITSEPSCWASLLSEKNPLHGSISYPASFIIEDIKEDKKNGYTGMKAGGYGFSLSCLVQEDKIKLDLRQKFKVGDKVKVVRKDFKDNKPFWAPAMDKCIGEVFEIEVILSSGYIIHDWSFHPDWLDLVEDNPVIEPGKVESIKFRAGDIIRMKKSCSGSREGEEYILIEDSTGILWAGTEADRCSCRHKWEFVRRGSVEVVEEKIKETIKEMDIIKKIKDLTLSKEDRSLRENGFEDENGKPTGLALNMMNDELLAEKWSTRRTDIAKDLIKIKAEEK